LEEEEFRQELQKMDGGLVTHGFTGAYSKAEYQTIFPTRMILHLEQDYPLIVVAPEQSFLANFVRQYGCALLVDKKDDKLLQQACLKIKMGGAEIDDLLNNSHNTLQLFSSKSVMKTLVHELSAG
jgi:hypothetical protein